MREIRFILFTIVVLIVTGILIVSCSTTPPPQTVKRTISIPMPVVTNGKTMTRMVTMSVALPPKTNRFYQVQWDAPTNTVGQWVPVTTVSADRLAPVPVVFQGVVIWPDHYRLEVGLTSDAFHVLADNIKTNFVLVAVSNMPTVCGLRVFAVNGSAQSAPSTEVYRGVFSNGNIYAGAYYWVADSNSVYRLSNSPLTTIRWTNLTVISNRSGLVAVPLPEKMGQLRWSAEK